MRAWIAAITVLGVLALGTGCGRDASRDRGHAAHAHAVLVSKILAKRRAVLGVDRALPEPRPVVVAPDRSFARIAPPLPVIPAPAPPAVRGHARAPPSV